MVLFSWGFIHLVIFEVRFEDLDLFQNDAHFIFYNLFITCLRLYQKGLENESLIVFLLKKGKLNSKYHNV